LTAPGLSNFRDYDRIPPNGKAEKTFFRKKNNGPRRSRVSPRPGPPSRAAAPAPRLTPRTSPQATPKAAPQSGPRSGPGEKLSGRPRGRPGGKPAERSGGRPGGKSGGRLGGKPGERSGGKPGGKARRKRREIKKTRKNPEDRGGGDWGQRAAGAPSREEAPEKAIFGKIPERSGARPGRVGTRPRRVGGRFPGAPGGGFPLRKRTSTNRDEPRRTSRIRFFSCLFGPGGLKRFGDGRFENGFQTGHQGPEHQKRDKIRIRREIEKPTFLSEKPLFFSQKRYLKMTRKNILFPGPGDKSAKTRHFSAEGQKVPLVHNCCKGEPRFLSPPSESPPGAVPGGSFSVFRFRFPRPRPASETFPRPGAPSGVPPRAPGKLSGALLSNDSFESGRRATPSNTHKGKRHSIF
jgi:hypothetical protein